MENETGQSYDVQVTVSKCHAKQIILGFQTAETFDPTWRKMVLLALNIFEVEEQLVGFE